MFRNLLLLVISVSVLSGYWKSQSMVEMRDGVKLHTNMYLPQPLEGSYPVILLRTPYNADNIDGATEFIAYIVDVKGYILVVQDTRYKRKI